jgi:16S rRNA C1402 N4-methylase RsmH
MNQTQGLTAAEWLKQTSESEIADTLYLYGEEKRSRIIAATIKKYQKIKILIQPPNLPILSPQWFVLVRKNTLQLVHFKQLEL